jgi:hypothetical protein
LLIILFVTVSFVAYRFSVGFGAKASPANEVSDLKVTVTFLAILQNIVSVGGSGFSLVATTQPAILDSPYRFESFIFFSLS